MSKSCATRFIMRMLEKEDEEEGYEMYGKGGLRDTDGNACFAVR